MSALTKHTANKIVQTVEAFGLCPHFYYSGRGMYGKQCFGIAGDPVTIGECLAAIKVDLISYDYDDAEKAIRLLSRDCRDSMGRDVIVYFPSLYIPDPNPSTIDET